ncbi:MAG: glycosyltransferase [Pseudomonadota bacterium]
MAEVDILLGTHNGARHLGGQLGSIAGQTMPDWTMLVSDDGSHDETVDIVTRFARARPAAALRLLKGPGKGPAANYLHMLRHADRRAFCLALADQDDLWFPIKLARAVSVLRRLPRQEPVLYAAQTTLIDAAGRPLKARKPCVAIPAFSNALVQNITAGNTIVLNRAASELAARAMPNPLPPFHDWWLYALMTGAGATIVIDPMPVLAYRQHGNSTLGAHAGLGARITRAKLVANGTWRRWLADHHAALRSVTPYLTPESHAQLDSLTAGTPRLALHRAGAYRQRRLGTAAIGLAALAGLA